nr:Chain B, RCO1 isoform 1 [Saccharomyces cerevisiae]
ENEDFCSACNQSGSFLCCDTCPKSFHFLCLDPPIDPNNLPKGDWHCNECKFKIFINNSMATLKKIESNFIKQNNNVKIFAKLLFNIDSHNPKQFQLPNYIKETFPAVKTGSRGQYSDE